MKIAHITNIDQVGGTNTNCLNFISNCTTAQHTLFVLGSKGEMERRWNGVLKDVHYLNIISEGRLIITRRLQSVFSKHKFDFIISWSNLLIPEIKYSLGRNSPLLLVHLGNPNSIPKVLDIFIALEFFFLQSPSKLKLFSCSEFVRNSFLQSIGYRNFSNKVIYNPLSKVPGEHSFKKTKNTFFKMGMVARLDNIKDHLTLIVATSILKQQGFDFKIEFVGDGPLRNKLEIAVKECDCESVISFVGNVNDVYRYLNTWDLVLHSTTKLEGLGNSVIEAVCFGIPVLVSDLPMMREIDAGLDGVNYFKSGNPEDAAKQVCCIYSGYETYLSKAISKSALFRQRFSATNYVRNLLSYASE
jgi:glycosyltransferase involved in cell wall biosynthesis